MIRSLIVAIACILLTASSVASARCFEFVGDKPNAVGPITLSGPADQICYNRVSTMSGRVYHRISFADKDGDLAQLASQTELMGRCPGFCRTYVLTSGNSNGKNVDPDNTRIEFQVERTEGNVTIGNDTYKIRKLN